MTAGIPTIKNLETFRRQLLAALDGAGGGGTSVLVYGAKGDGATDDTPALQATIDAVGAEGGGNVWMPPGNYKITAPLRMDVDGVYLRGGGSKRNLATKISNAGSGNAIFVGPGLGSLDAAHFNSVGISNLAVVGNASSAAGVRADNCALRLDNVWSEANGGRGVHLSRGWESLLIDSFSQSNMDDNWYLEDGCNAISMIQCSGLSSALKNGLTISGGSRGCSNIALIAFDGEGCNIGLYLDTSTGNISGLVVIAANFESNTGFAVKQAATGNLFHTLFMAGQFYGTGNGVSLTNAFASEFHAPKLFDANLDISGNKDVLIFQPRLEGTATINAGVVVSNLLGAYPNGSVALGVASDTFRHPIRVRRGAAWRSIQDIAGATQTLTGTGGITATLDLFVGSMQTVETNDAATTGLTVALTNDGLVTDEELVVSISNTGGAAGNVAWPVSFKLTGTVAIPATNKKTTLRLLKDGNGLYWETARAVGAG